jgi:hypothetical protein
MGGKLMPVEVYPVIASGLSNLFLPTRSEHIQTCDVLARLTLTFSFTVVAAAVGCSVYALSRKWFSDPQITVAKNRRSGGTSVAYVDCEEATPFWSSRKHGSISIFGDSANPILENNMKIAAGTTVGGTYTVTLPEDTSDDDDEDSSSDAIEELEVIKSADEAAASEVSEGDDA